MSQTDVKNIEFDLEKFRRSIQEAGLTYEEVSLKAGFPQINTVSKILSKSRNVTADELLRVAAFFGKNPVEFQKSC